MMLREFIKDRSPAEYMKILEMCRLIEERVDADAAERSPRLIPEDRQIVKTVLDRFITAAYKRIVIGVGAFLGMLCFVFKGT